MALLLPPQKCISRVAHPVGQTEKQKRGRRMLKGLRGILYLSILVAFVAGCGDDTAVNGNGNGTKQVTVEIANESGDFEARSAGLIDTAGIAPGDSVVFGITAPRGSRLSFITMFVESNDWFYAPGDSGISLWNDLIPITGDLTDSIYLWDAGTEVNQPVGQGANQPPRQSAPNTGADDPLSSVRVIEDEQYSADSNLVVRVENQDGDSFTVTIRVRDSAVTPVSPGVWAVHSGDNPFFTPGSETKLGGLESLAEDGNTSALLETIDSLTGIATPLSPGIWAVAMQNQVLFTTGDSASEGLESLAEDGNPATLKDSLDAQNIRAETFGSAPLPPGESFTFSVTVAPDDQLFFATMLVQSNDLFFAPDENGIPIYPSGGDLLTGDITDMVMLWDAGTEVNETPGAGPNQAPRQSGPNTGAEEDSVVTLFPDSSTFGMTQRIIRVTVSEDN